MSGLLKDRLDGPPVGSGQAHVVASLGRDIVSGRIEEGGALPGDDALAERFGVSRTVLREAMKTLAAKGLIRAKPRAGTHVRRRPHWNLLDAEVLGWHVDDGVDEALLGQLAEMRLAVEPAIAALAAERAAPSHVRTMRDCLVEMAEAGSDRDFALADLALHREMIEASGNVFMHSAGALIEVALLSVFRLGSPANDPVTQAEVTAAHGVIVEAVEQRRPDAAAEAMRSVIRIGRQRIAAKA